MTVFDVSVADRVATIALNRPPVNACTVEMYIKLREALVELGKRLDVSVVLLVSQLDRCFCAGADLKELRTLFESGDISLDEDRQRAARDLYADLIDQPQVVIAAVNGPAIGAGAVLAACCDVRYASTRASFALTEIDVGRCGGARHMMRVLPQGLVRELFFTGARLSAEDAHRLGLVQRLLQPDDLLGAARELARTIAEKSPAALRIGKEALNKCEALPVKDGYAAEQEATLRLAQTPDAHEALAAVLEKRRPVWQSDGEAAAAGHP